MNTRLLGALGLAISLLAGGCRPTPELQGAAITTPQVASPVPPPTDFAPAAVSPTPVETTELVLAALALQSAAFGPGGAIPARFSCDGEDISPELTWGPTPEGTASYALIMDDPDAPGGTWVHWVIYNLPPDAGGLPEAVPAKEELPDGSRQGTNSGKGVGYAGPCPPGETHRYFFKLYALDQELDLAEGVTADELTAAIQGHILGQAALMGTYSRD